MKSEPWLKLTLVKEYLSFEYLSCHVAPHVLKDLALFSWISKRTTDFWLPFGQELE